MVYVAVPALYMAMEVFRALCTEAMYAKSQDRVSPAHPSLILLLIEVAKLVISCAFLRFQTNKISWKYLPLFIAHSLLYFINNSLYYYAFKFSTAGSIQLLLHMRLPMTAILHHFLIKRQYRITPWIALTGLFIGVVCTQLTDEMKFGGSAIFTLCFTISINSAMAAVYNEKLLKSLQIDFWEQQMYIYLLGSFWCTIYSLSSSDGGLIRHWDVKGLAELFTVFVVFFGAMSGLSVGFLIKKLDNIIKLIANALATIIIAVAVFLLFGKRDTNMTAFVVGSLLVLASTALYAHSTAKKQEKQEDYIELSSEYESLENNETSGASPIIIFRIIIIMILIEFGLLFVISKA